MRSAFASTLTVVALCATMCHAAGYNYSIYYHSGGAANTSKTTFISNINAHDGNDGLAWVPDQHQAWIYVSQYKTAGANGWTGDTGWYVGEWRRPLEIGGMTVFDNIYLWATPSVTPQYLSLYLQSRPYLTHGLSYTLYLDRVPSGITYSGPRQWGPDHEAISLPFYASEDGTSGYKFRLVLTAVPEPSSLAALGGGVMGLLALRRRRR